MATKVEGLGIGLERIRGSKSWIFVRGESLTAGNIVTIQAKSTALPDLWIGTIKNGHINSGHTVARVKMTCINGVVDENADNNEGNLTGPGDIIDVEITVTGEVPPASGEEGGVIVFP